MLLSTAGVLGLGLMCVVRLGPRQLLATPPDDLAMMFRGTYTTDFYREIRDLLAAANTAQCGWFSSDRTIAGYAAWRATPAGRAS